MPTCFSPLTRRFPLAKTSVTVTVMVPVNALLLLLSPLPSKEKADVAARFEPRNDFPGSPLSAVTPKPLLLARPVFVSDFLLALVFSTIEIVSVSPTRRALRSSNRRPLARPTE